LHRRFLTITKRSAPKKRTSIADAQGMTLHALRTASGACQTRIAVAMDTEKARPCSGAGLTQCSAKQRGHFLDFWIWLYERPRPISVPITLRKSTASFLFA
jgi:hypothetical protein